MLQIGAPLSLTDGPSPWSTIRVRTADRGADGGTGAAVAALDVIDDERRVRLGLPFLDGDRVIDVSIQPGVWIDRIAQAAETAGVAPNVWKDRIRADLISAGIDAGWWLAAEMSRQDAVTVAMRAAWPLLRSTPRTEREIPRWAVPLVQGPTVADGARRLLGDRVTRPVIRALGERLEAEVDWWPLALATAARDVRGDHLARLIDTAGSGGEVLPTVDDVELLAHVLAGVDPLRINRLVATPPGTEPADHVDALLHAADGWRRSMPHIGALPPSVALMEQRLTAMHGDGRRTVTPIRRTPNPAPHRWPSHEVHPAEILGGRSGPEAAVGSPSPNDAATPADLTAIADTAIADTAPDEADPPWQTPRMAPIIRAAERVEIGDRFDHPPQARRLDQQRSGDVSLVLPDGPAQLSAWGDQLQNCLADYVDAVATGRSIVLGVRVGDELVGAVELDRALRVDQLLGPRNEPLPRRLEHVVIELLG